MSEEVTVTTSGADVTEAAAHETPPPTVQGPDVSPQVPPEVVQTVMDLAPSTAPPDQPAPMVTAADYDALRSQLEELRGKFEKAGAAQEEHAARLEKQAAAMRSTLMEKLGIKSKFQSYAPDVDPFTADGREKLETWATDHPELCESKAPTPEPGTMSDVKDKPGAWMIPSTEVLQNGLRSLKALERELL